MALRGEMEDLPGPARTIARAAALIGAAQLDDVGVELGEDPRRMVSRDASAVIATTSGGRSACPAVRASRARPAASSSASSRGVPATTFSPMASAPARTAARTPSASVMPQILTDGRRATLAGSSGCAPAATKARTAAAGSSDRTSASPTSAPSNPSARQRRRRRVADPRFGDDEPVVGHELTQSCGLVDIDLERAQVAVVEPDQPGAGGKGTIQLARVVDLDQRLEADLERPFDQPGESLGRMQDREQQDEVGARRAEHRELDSSTTKSLARTGIATAARTARRSSTEPPNQCGSHRTEMAAAPPVS